MNRRSLSSICQHVLRHHGLPLLMAFSAGLTALSFQLVWLRLAIQQLGASASTVAAVIATALLGLSVGAMSCGRWADRSQRPILILGCAFVACATVIVATATGDGFFAGWAGQVYSPSPTGRWIGEPSAICKLVFAVCALFPVNLLLGSTLPFLVRDGTGSHATPTSFAGTLGRLYASETLGAAVGAIAVGFWLIPGIGLQATLYLGATVIGVVGLLAISVSWRSSRLPLPPPAAESQSTSTDRKFHIGLFLLIVALSGSATLGMEVIWQRFFVVLFGSDTHSYAIVAASYLLGISLGAVASATVVRISRNDVLAYASTMIAIGAAAIAVTMVALNLASGNLSFFNSQLLVLRPVTARIVIAVSLLLGPTTLIGIAFPVAARIWTTDLGRAASSTAHVYSAALVGNVVGVLTVGFYLIPTAGLRSGMLFLAGTCVFSGVALILLFLLRRSASPGLSIRSVFFFAGIGLLLTVWAVGSARLARQFWPVGVASQSDEWRLQSYAEGAVHTVAVVSNRNSPDIRRMIVDGVTIGESAGGVDEKQQMLAHLPFLLRRDRTGQRALTIGLGTGILAGELARNPLVDEVWVVELSGSVIAAASCFSDHNGDVLQHPKAEIIRADGIQFLRNNDILYDAIVSDAKSRPGYAANVPFFSRDYYQISQSRLASDGLFVQWVSLESSADSVAVILQSFAGVFEYGHVAVAAPDSIFLVGTNQPLQLSRPHLEQHLQQELSKSLTRYAWNSYGDFTSLYWLDQQVVQSFFNQHPMVGINTLDHPVLESCTLAELGASEFLNKRENLDQLMALIDFDAQGGIGETVFNSQPLSNIIENDTRDNLASGRRSAREIAMATRTQLQRGDHWLDEAAQHYRKAIEFTPDLNRQAGLAEIYRQLARQAHTTNRVEREFSALSAVSELNVSTADEQNRLASILMQFEKPELALDYYYRAIALDPDNAGYHADFGFCLLKLKKNSQAVARFRRVIQRDPDNIYGHAGLGIALFLDGQQDSAWKHLRLAGDSSAELLRLIEEHGISWRDVPTAEDITELPPTGERGD